MGGATGCLPGGAGFLAPTGSRRMLGRFDGPGMDDGGSRGRLWRCWYFLGGAEPGAIGRVSLAGAPVKNSTGTFPSVERCIPELRSTASFLVTSSEFDIVGCELRSCRFVSFCEDLVGCDRRRLDLSCS